MYAAMAGSLECAEQLACEAGKDGGGRQLVENLLHIKPFASCIRMSLVSVQMGT